MLPLVCVITPTKNVMQYLDRFFDSINKINYPKGRLIWIFADGESTDGTFEYLRTKKIGFKKIVITKKNSTRPNTRNEAYRYVIKNKIKHDFIATVDADVEIYPEFFNRLLKHFKNKRVGMVSSYFIYTNNKFLEDYTNSYLGKKLGKVVDTGFCPTGCAIFRKGCFDFFDENFECHEDGDLSMSITEKGWIGLQDFTNTCPHIKNQTIKKELKELYGMGRYEPLLWMKHPKYFWNIKTFFGSIYYMIFVLSVPLFFASLLVHSRLVYLLPFMFFISFIIHFMQIKSNPLKRILYSLFTILRFVTYFTAVIHRLMKVPFRRIRFKQLDIEAVK